MLKRETRTIDGMEVTSQQLPAMKAYRLLTRLSKLVNPLARAMTPELLAAAKAGAFDVLAPLAVSIFAELDPVEAETLAMDVLAATSVVFEDEGTLKRTKVDLANLDAINRVFTGRLKAMLQTMWMALEINYSSFFPEIDPAAAKDPTPSV